MIGESEIYNSRIFRAYIEYMHIHYPGVNSGEIMMHAGITEEDLYDQAHYFSQEQFNSFYEVAVRMTRDTNLCRDVGRFTLSSKDFGLMKSLMLGVIDTQLLYELVPRVWSRVARNCSYSSISTGDTSVEVIASPRPGCSEKPFQCEVRMGILESLARFSTKQNAIVEHTACIHKGDRHCRYSVTWQPRGSSLWKSLRIWLTAITMLTAFALMLLLPNPAWGFVIMGLLIASLVLSLVSYRIGRRKIKDAFATQDAIVKDILELSNTRYGNALLIQELGQATSGHTEIGDLCERVMEVMHTHLEYERGAIMLANLQKTYLEFTSSFGISDEEKTAISTVFPVEIHAREILMQAIMNSRPYIINDLDSIASLITENDRRIIESLDVKTGIVVPLLYGDEAIGILIVANSAGKKLNNDIDLTLVRGMASQIAVSIINTRSYQKLEESEKKYRTIFESTPIATTILEEDLTISLANSGLVTLTGFSRSDLEGRKSWVDFFPEEDAEHMKILHKISQAVPSFAPKNYEARIIDSKGTVREVDLTVDIIPGTGRSVVSLMDITDRIKTAREFEERSKYLESLIEAAPDAVIALDAGHRIVEWNPGSEHLFGYKKNDVIGKRLDDVITAPEGQDASLIESFSREGKLKPVECVRYRSDHAPVNVIITGSPIVVGSVLRGYIVLYRDITLNKRAEEENRRLQDQLLHAQKMEAVGTLAGGIAHDFNNILMGLQGNISIMLMELAEEHGYRSRLKSMEKYIERGAGLTKRLLGFARGGKYEVKPTSLSEHIMKSIEMFGRTHKEITIHTSHEGSLWTVDVDRGQIDQVFLNLFVNAWQAMPEGGELFVETKNVILAEEWVKPYDINPGRYVMVSVRDTGIGIEESIRDRIFDPFFTTKEKGANSGLGLASVYGIVTNHGGAITCLSEKDKGATFTIYLPACDKPVEVEPEQSSEIHTGKETILLVDDEDMILSVGKEILDKLGYNTIVAKGGSMALSMYGKQHEQIDLVILDMIMPGMGGRETFNGLKGVNADVKVLLASGYDLHDQTQDLMDRGCLGFIQKPFSIPSLSAKIRECLDPAAKRTLKAKASLL